MNQRTDLAFERGRAFRSWLLRTISLCSILLFWVACRSSHGPLPNQPAAATSTTLSAGDTIKLTFPGANELTQSQKVRADGKVNLPLVGEVAASGKTIAELQTQLTRLYKPQLRNSNVVVTLESGNATVIVSGFVARPGKLSFDRPTSVFQAIMEAGGVSQYGSLSNIHLVRTINGQQHTEIIDLRPALRGHTVEANYVRDGDVIYVLQKVF